MIRPHRLISSAVLLAFTSSAGCASLKSRESLTPRGLFVATQGQGPPLVLVGGGGMDLRQWDAVAADLARDFRVIRFDHRGWGRSSAPRAPFSRTHDLLEVLDHVGAQRPLFVGSSFGGGVVIDFALAYPDRIAAMVVIGSELSGYTWSQAFQDRGARFAQADSARRIQLLLHDPHFIPAARKDAVLRGTAESLLRDNLHKIFAQDFTLVQAAEPTLDRLDHIGVPMMVVTPELDHPDLFQIAHILADRVPRAASVVMKGSGHLPHLENPRDVAALVREFAARVKASNR